MVCKPIGSLFRTVEADSGYCINAIQSRKAETGCVELAFVELPLAVIESEYSAESARLNTDPIICETTGSDDANSFVYCSYRFPPRAILVDARAVVFGMDVLSAPEYNR